MSESSEVEQGTPAQNIFMSQLQRMIIKERHTGCIDWLPSPQGGFVIHLKQVFSENVLPRYFGQAKYTSFTRRLKRWGFKRAGNSGAYHHENFQRDMVFDLDFDTEPGHPASLTDSSSDRSRSLPLKKRTKWTSPPSSSRLAEHPPLSRHGSPSSAHNSDVKVMPELMRTINRQKRKERMEDGASSPPSKRTATYSETPLKRTSTLEGRVEAAQTLASLGRQSTPQNTVGSFLTAGTYSTEHFRLPTPPLYNAYMGLQRGRMATQQSSKVRQLKCSHDYSSWCDIDSDFYSLLQLHLSKNDGHDSHFGLCQLTSDSKRVPILGLLERNVPAFNRAA